MRRALALLFACSLWLITLNATAQGINDIPSPDEIRNTNTSSLRVDWPTDGEIVKVPFTITGVAAPGARLELWLGGELERKFIADANGRFNTAVSKTTDGAVEVRHVGGGPDPIETVTVRVVFGGAAAAVAAGQQNPTSADGTPPPPDSIDPFTEGEAPAKTGALPRVSELDGAANSGMAPVPPPPTASSAFGAESTTAAPGDPVESLEVVAPTRRKKTPSRAARYFAEAGIGLSAGLAIGFGGAMLGVGIGLAANDGFAAIGLGALGGLAGAAVGIPIGVVLTGNMMDGNGKWWAAVLGELAGILLASAITAAYANAFYDASVPILSFALFPALGAAAGYELTSDPSAQDAAARTSRLSPAIGRTADGDMTFGLKLQF